MARFRAELVNNVLAQTGIDGDNAAAVIAQMVKMAGALTQRGKDCAQLLP